MFTNDLFPRILDRYNPWTMIGITVECFAAVCQLAGLTPYFLNFVIGIGRKFQSKDEDFMSFYSTFSSNTKGPSLGPSSEAVTRGDSRWGSLFLKHNSITIQLIYCVPRTLLQH